MSQVYVGNGPGGSGGGNVTSVTGANGVSASPTTGAVVVSGINATTSTVGVASFNPEQFIVTVGGEVYLSGNIISNWTDEATSFPAVPGNGYFIIGTATATLPSSPSQGNVVSFIVDTTDILTIQANTGQYIRNASDITVSGGTAVNNFKGDSIELVYRAMDATWFAFTASGGTWSLT